MTILLPPGALDDLKPTPRRGRRPVHVDPRVLRRVAPPQPMPAPQPKEPERVVKDSAQRAGAQAQSHRSHRTTAAKVDVPKPPVKLETPKQQPTDHSSAPAQEFAGQLASRFPARLPR